MPPEPFVSGEWGKARVNIDYHVLQALSFDDRFGLLVEAEWLARKNKRLALPWRVE